jgi:zinc/manganese transport system permease protein
MNATASDLLSILGPPLLAGVLALIAHIPLGQQVLRRGVVFMDLAIAQVAALGVLLGGVRQDNGLISMLCGGLAALSAAALVAWLARRWPAHREALIGLVYVASAALALIILSGDPHGSQRLRSLVSGDVLWVQLPALWPLLLASVVMVWVTSHSKPLLQRDSVFYPLFAIVVSFSVPLMGIYLVFALLIAPALSISQPNQTGPNRQLIRAGSVGLIGFTSGLLVSYGADQPSGPCIVVALIACSSLATLSLRRPGSRQTARMS